jgi:hypothetical protein
MAGIDITPYKRIQCYRFVDLMSIFMQDGIGLNRIFLTASIRRHAHKVLLRIATGHPGTRMSADIKRIGRHQERALSIVQRGISIGG